MTCRKWMLAQEREWIKSLLLRRIQPRSDGQGISVILIKSSRLRSEIVRGLCTSPWSYVYGCPSGKRSAIKATIYCRCMAYSGINRRNKKDRSLDRKNKGWRASGCDTVLHFYLGDTFKVTKLLAVKNFNSSFGTSFAERKEHCRDPTSLGKSMAVSYQVNKHKASANMIVIVMIIISQSFNAANIQVRQWTSSLVVLTSIFQTSPYPSGF